MKGNVKNSMTSADCVTAAYLSLYSCHYAQLSLCPVVTIQLSLCPAVTTAVTVPIYVAAT